MYGLLLLLLVISLLALGLGQNRETRQMDVLVRQSARYAIAAEQDLSPLIALLHANYAAGYLWALKDIASEEEVVQLRELEEYVKKVQDIATKRVTSACPQFVGPVNVSIARLAGNV